MPFDPDQFLGTGTVPAPTAEPVVEEKKPVLGFDPDAFINSGRASDVPTEISTTDTPMPQFYYTGETGVSKLARDVYGAVKPNIGAMITPTMNVYRAHPVFAPAVDALGLTTVGVPPIAAAQSALGLMDKYKAAKDVATDLSKTLSTSELIESPITGRPYPESVPAFRNMQRAVPEIADKLSEIYQKGGGNNAVRAWLGSEEAAQYMNNPAFREAAEQYVGKVPGLLSQVGRVVGPLARGAVKVLGPVGTAMNIYEAQEFARESELGPRLAEGQGQIAQRNFRNMNVPYGPDFNKTITATQAKTILDSGNERDIAAFGGRQQLEQQAAGQFLENAAELARKYRGVKRP